jgi:hypothetical protein
VGRFIAHDGRMNSPQRLASGLPLLGRLHALLADVAVSPAGRAVGFASRIGLELAGKTPASLVRRRMKRLQWRSGPGSGRPRGRASDIGVLTAISPV